MSDLLVLDTAKVNLTIIQGSSWEVNITMSSNNELDLNDFSFRGAIKHTRRDRFATTNFQFEVTSEDSFRMYLDPAQSTKLTKKSYRYDVEMYTANGNVDTYVAKLIEGRITVDPTISG